jgi:predicted metal-binding protein
MVISSENRHRTPSRNLIIQKFITKIGLNHIKVNKDKFKELCKNGCRNYNQKYSCPPFSPDFANFTSGYRKMLVVCFRINLKQYEPLPFFQRIKASNAILKSKMDQELLTFKRAGNKVAGSGSCRFCRVCGAKKNESCKKPEKRMYSLESLGVDVDDLVKRCFGFPLLWYKIDGNFNPEYTSAVGGVLFR